MFRASLVCILLSVSALQAADGDLQLAPIGDFRLESGQAIRNCTIGFRTFGALNASRSNAILFPTWFTGTTEQLKGLIGPGKLADSSKFFVIAVDALGDGVSSSSSNSTVQPGLRFPNFTIHDMVATQHLLLTRKLGLTHLRSVMGISMGGMQVFDWITSYPEFMDQAVAIVGSPRLSPVDLLLWTTEKHALEAGADWNSGDYRKPPERTMRAVADMHQFALTSPAAINREVDRAKFAEMIAKSEKSTLEEFDANNWLRQLEAMLGQDISKRFDGSMERAAQTVKARVLIIAASQDHMVNPDAALDFARLLHSEPVVLKGDCGHLATLCEQQTVAKAVHEFLQ
jgi:homoserine O-acetyltransferase